MVDSSDLRLCAEDKLIHTVVSTDSANNGQEEPGRFTRDEEAARRPVCCRSERWRFMDDKWNQSPVIVEDPCGHERHRRRWLARNLELSVLDFQEFRRAKPSLPVWA